MEGRGGTQPYKGIKIVPTVYAGAHAGPILMYGVLGLNASQHVITIHSYVKKDKGMF